MRYFAVYASFGLALSCGRSGVGFGFGVEGTNSTASSGDGSADGGSAGSSASSESTAGTSASTGPGTTSGDGPVTSGATEADGSGSSGADDWDGSGSAADGDPEWGGDGDDDWGGDGDGWGEGGPSSATTTTGTTSTTGTTGPGTSGPMTDTSGGDGDGDGDGDGASCDPGVAGVCGPEAKCGAYRSDPGNCCVDTNTCAPLYGFGRLGDPCVREAFNDDCGDTLFCLVNAEPPTSAMTGAGFCRQLCDVGDLDACAQAGQPDASCVAFNDGVLPLCDDSCSPFDGGCSAGLGCYHAGWEWLCMEPAAPAGSGNDGDPCDRINDCAPGLVCRDASDLSDCAAGRCCTAICDASASACPGLVESCVRLYAAGSGPVGSENAGYCGI